MIQGLRQIRLAVIPEAILPRLPRQAVEAHPPQGQAGHHRADTRPPAGLRAAQRQQTAGPVQVVGHPRACIMTGVLLRPPTRLGPGGPLRPAKRLDNRRLNNHSHGMRARRKPIPPASILDRVHLVGCGTRFVGIPCGTGSCCCTCANAVNKIATWDFKT